MADTVLNPDAANRFRHLQNLIQMLDNRDLEEVVLFVTMLLEQDRRPDNDAPAVGLVPVQRPPRRLDD